MKLAGLGKLYAIMYDDRMDVQRYVKHKNDDGTTQVDLDPTPIATDVPCRISFTHSDMPKDKDVDMDKIDFSPKVFCAPTVDLKAGDVVVIRRYSDDGQILHTYTGSLAMPSWYATHQEANIDIDEGA